VLDLDEALREELVTALMTKIGERIAQVILERLATPGGASIQHTELVATTRRRHKAESCFDIARRSKLIGAAKTLPPDLSHSRTHMAGFGDS
jgi:hypothetical protein